MHLLFALGLLHNIDGADMLIYAAAQHAHTDANRPGQPTDCIARKA
jgi:hypothetical protein